MLSSIILAVLPLLSGALAAPGPIPQPQPLAETDDLIGPRQAGGYFWSYWSEGGGSFNCNNGAGADFTVDWSGDGGFVCGKGWNPGGPRYTSRHITSSKT
ncbi:glycoside hydrolase family 11 protein [Candidatus Bathyarchaeota archaeon]|nr:glycoside hydrolase family 11 protein [Candidatus Bathyarchaeota archaeon]